MKKQTTKESIEKQSIQEQLKNLIAERDDFLTQANQQVSFYNGAIQTLENLLTPVEENNGDTNND